MPRLWSRFRQRGRVDVILAIRGTVSISVESAIDPSLEQQHGGYFYRILESASRGLSGKLINTAQTDHAQSCCTYILAKWTIDSRTKRPLRPTHASSQKSTDWRAARTDLIRLSIRRPLQCRMQDVSMLRDGKAASSAIAPTWRRLDRQSIGPGPCALAHIPRLARWWVAAVLGPETINS